MSNSKDSIIFEEDESDIEIISVSKSNENPKPIITFESVKQKLSLKLKCSSTTTNSFQKKKKSKAETSLKSSPKKIASKRTAPSSPSINSNKFIPNMLAKNNWLPAKKACLESNIELFVEENSNTSSSLHLNPDNNDDSNQGYMPYYLENFIYVIDNTLCIEDDRRLFTSHDLHYIDKFKSLSEDCQKLYIRLYGRKLQWFRETHLKYTNISLDLRPLLRDLCDEGFLINDINSVDCSTLLNLLQLPELIEIGKEYKITKFNSQTTKRTFIIDELLKLTTTKNLFTMLGGSGNPVLEKLKKRILKVLGNCFTLSNDAKSVFSRIFLLFSLTSAQDIEDSGQKTQKDLFEILQIKRGEVKYPKYNVYRQSAIFSNRQELLNYDTVFQYYTKMVMAFTTHKFDLAVEIHNECEQNFPFKQFVCVHPDLPGFLKRYTLSAILIRMKALLAECYEKLRNYTSANSIYMTLIAKLSDVQASSVRLGKWYDRLALNLERHLKETSQALLILKSALQDKRINGANRLALYYRAKRLVESKAVRNKKIENENFIADWIILQPNEVTIYGSQVNHRETFQGPSWIYRETMADGNERDVVCGVEQFVIYYYKDHDFEHGVHGESSTFWTLFALLCYEEVLFADNIPDVFYNERQVAPLDIFSSEFYPNRKDAVDKFLYWLSEEATDNDIFSRIQFNWENHYEERCLGVDWQLFPDASSVYSLVHCLGRVVVCRILKLFCTEARLWRSGMPDLVVWSERRRAAKIIEVKGPGDKLSNKQILWLDRLVSFGADAEVCYVKNANRRKRLHSP